MSFYSKTDKEVSRLIGRRLRKHRLDQNLTQAELSAKTLLSVSTIQAAEGGKCKLETVIAIIRELRLLHEFEKLLEPAAISPLQLVERDAPRKRARTKKQTRTGSQQ